MRQLSPQSIRTPKTIALLFGSPFSFPAPPRITRAGLN
jgi:hypothetical protein